MFCKAASCAILFSVFLLGSAPAIQAQSANPAWLDQLSEQLAIEKDCAVD